MIDAGAIGHALRLAHWGWSIFERVLTSAMLLEDEIGDVSVRWRRRVEELHIRKHAKGTPQMG